jgi:hypothetical protein
MSSLEEYREIFKQPDLSEFENSEDFELIKFFYSKLFERLSKIDESKKKKNDKNYIATPVEDEIFNIIKFISKKNLFIEKQKNIANKNYNREKKIDLYID